MQSTPIGIMASAGAIAGLFSLFVFAVVLGAPTSSGWGSPVPSTFNLTTTPLVVVTAGIRAPTPSPIIAGIAASSISTPPPTPTGAAAGSSSSTPVPAGTPSA